jgi:hypothetical protein
VELSFISTTRNDKQTGLKATLQRKELMELILRLAQNWVKQQYSSKERVADHIPEFIDLFLMPTYNTSPIVLDRKIINQSKKLNQLLFDNMSSLERMFSDLKNNSDQDGSVKFFTFDVAQGLFRGINSNFFEITTREIDVCFIYSMMTVLNEQLN